MNILFLLFHGLSNVSGISKKIIYQMDGLRANGHHVVLCHYEIRGDGHRVRMIDDTILEDYGNSKLAPLRKRMCYGAIFRYIKEQNIQFVYVRSYHNANPFTIHLFERLQQSSIKIVMEIATFPYDQEYQHLPLSWQTELLIDKLYRCKLAKTSNGIITFSDANRIFGKNTIRISNGIDFNHVLLKTKFKQVQQEIHFIAVAEVHYWHGYDRIIAGVGLYNQSLPSRKVFLHIVGGLGSTEQNLFEALVKKYNLQDIVLFHGQRQGEELESLFNISDFAIGSLGRHRSGIDKIKTLKNREYAARGIPFVYSETDSDFDTMPYVLKVPADESPINVPEILAFLDSLTIIPQEIRDSISHLSWKKQMQKVITHVFSEKMPDNEN